MVIGVMCDAEEMRMGSRSRSRSWSWSWSWSIMWRVEDAEDHSDGDDAMSCRGSAAGEAPGILGSARVMVMLIMVMTSDQ